MTFHIENEFVTIEEIPVEGAYPMSLKPLPIGVEDFKDLITNGYYYVDKTVFIKELLELKGKVNLFTRPRRFGKTLNLSMLRYYLENTENEEEMCENRKLFDGLRIMEMGSSYTDQMGTYPVISLSLKSGKQGTFDSACFKLCEELSSEFGRHREVRNDLPPEKKTQFQAILEGSASRDIYSGALKFLSEALWRHYGKPAVILIDEYDVPLENAYFQGFYDEMIQFIRSLFEAAFKTNPYLEFAVITGCLRITKESIFTGLNNLKMNSILSDSYGEHFGFTQPEIDEMLQYYGREAEADTIREWYDGYRFGQTEVYNPWSLVNHVDALRRNPAALPVPYWANTSSNLIVKDLVEHADISLKGELEGLIAGDSIEKTVHEEITYEDIDQSEDNLWNFLFFTGYLKQTSIRLDGETRYVSFAIPNMEVRYIYKNTILHWFDRMMEGRDLNRFFRAVEDGNTSVMEEEISEILQETISFYDYAESYYHGFLTGILRNIKTFRVISNRESGLGRPDILLKTPSVRGMAVVIEIKTVKEYCRMADGCRAAVRQIQEKRYEESLKTEGYARILTYGVCFYQKECMVLMG